MLLAHDAPWPVVNGGRARVAGLHSVLQGVLPTRVLVPVNVHSAVTVTAPAEALPACHRSRLAAVASLEPRLGRGLLDARAAAAARDLSAGAAAVVVSHSFLVPGAGALGRGGPLVVDFPNLEVDRQASQGSLLGRVESLKAARWEPRVARRADLCVAVDEADAQRLRQWGAREVVVVPNAAEVPAAGPSPVEGYVLAVADWHYGPNRSAASALRAAGVPLVLAGRGSEQWPEGRGWIEDLAALYEGAAVVVAPATSGGGTQLKVVEAVCRGRVVVTTAYGARSLPQAARDACVVGDLDEGLRRVLREVDERHARERQLLAAELPRTWAAAGAPLVAVLQQLLSRGAAA